MITKRIEITVTAPVECTDKQFEEWVGFCTGYCGQISTENPLHEYDLDPSDITIY